MPSAARRWNRIFKCIVWGVGLSRRLYPGAAAPLFQRGGLRRGHKNAAAESGAFSAAPAKQSSCALLLYMQCKFTAK